MLNEPLYMQFYAFEFHLYSNEFNVYARNLRSFAQSSSPDWTNKNISLCSLCLCGEKN